MRHWFNSYAVGKELPLLLVFAQRRQFHLRPAGVGAMHGFAIMPQVFHRKTFGITGGLRPFRPSVTVTVQRDTLDAKSVAPLLELRRPVVGADGSQIRKQRAGARQVPENFRHVYSEAHDGNRTGFL